MSESSVLAMYVERLEGLLGERSGIEPAWLTAFRRAAFDQFASMGFPTTADEEWRFTPVGAIGSGKFAAPGASGSIEVRGDGSPQLVFVDGVYRPDLSCVDGIPRGVEVCPLSVALRRDPALLQARLGANVDASRNPFAALNGALFSDGVYVLVAAGVIVDAPISLVYVSTPQPEPVSVFVRNLILVGGGSRATFVEKYVGHGDLSRLVGALTEIEVGPGAIVDHCRVQREAPGTMHIGQTGVHIGEGGEYTSHAIATGGTLSRHDLGAVLSGEHCSCTMNGLYLGKGRQLMDNHTVIDHAMPNCRSFERYKGILDGQSVGVFNGKVFVRQDAQKTDAKQTNQALLLSDDARVHTKPQLEIYADDVRCTHGATVGQLDRDAMFYLRSRGIAAADARSVLIHAFASDIIERIPHESVRAELEESLVAALPSPSAVMRA